MSSCRTWLADYEQLCVSGRSLFINPQSFRWNTSALINSFGQPLVALVRRWDKFRHQEKCFSQDGLDKKQRNNIQGIVRKVLISQKQYCTYFIAWLHPSSAQLSCCWESVWLSFACLWLVHVGNNHPLVGVFFLICAMHTWNSCSLE